ncbi:hypothetical protein HPB50_019489 [Hyalomma asiaticum]|uniref:Uncharacterized protein n=1 Tax=Hyalomma asiaticum TaxID=266040 RepID=A0ACB7SFR8_HYAAI|nr:hypothetical protein HPB50_019489 [Hyalomma asiaticum]
MTLVKLSRASILLFALWSHGQYAAASAAPGGAPAGHSASPEPWTSAALVKDLSLGDPIVGVLKVDYGNGASVVINGSLTPSQTASAPKSVALIGASKCVPPFSLVMVDPDAPSRNGATQRSWLHWMVINARNTTELHKGEQLVPYEGPSPPPGTGPHRYVFLAYCQRGQAVNGAKLKPARRNKFSVKDVQKKLGESSPFAGTFFYADSATN